MSDRGEHRGSDGLAVSASMLDMLFSAFGAVVLMFCLMYQQARATAPERSESSQAQDAFSTAIDSAARQSVGAWPAVQALPVLDPRALFILDLSGSFGSDSQRNAQRGLVRHIVLTQEIEDFAVVLFADSAAELIGLGDLVLPEAVPAEDVAKELDSLERQLFEGGYPRARLERLKATGLLGKLAYATWFFRRPLAEREYVQLSSGATAFEPAFSTAVSTAKAASPGGEISAVLLSDGMPSGGSWLSFTGAAVGGRLHRGPANAVPPDFDAVFARRVAITLADGGSMLQAIRNMDAWAPLDGRNVHLVLSQYASAPEALPLPPSGTKEGVFLHPILYGTKK
jgi:hypothetical protein